MARYDQCDETCTVDCGHCKGAGPVTQEQFSKAWDDLLKLTSELQLPDIAPRAATVVYTQRFGGLPVAEAPVIAVLKILVSHPARDMD